MTTEFKFHPLHSVSVFLTAIVLFIFISFNCASAQPANHIVISEVAPMGGGSATTNTGEFIELYNPLAKDFTFASDVVLTSGEAAGSNYAAWTLSLAGKTIKAYGFLLIGDGGVTVTPDLLFPSNKNLSNGNSSRAYVQLKDNSGVIDAFGWDPVNVSPPNCEGASFRPSSNSSDKKSFERKSGISATAHDALGNAWDSNNNASDFFENTSAKSNPQNSSSPVAVNPYNISGSTGPGKAALSPALWKYDSSADIRITITTADSTIRGIKLVKPELISWNQSNISVQPSAASLSQSGDTTSVANLNLTVSDSLIITVAGVTSADSTEEISLNILSSTDGISFAPLKSLPSTIVYGNPRTAAQIKAKNPGGDYKLLGKYAIVKGVVTVADEFHGPAYLEDATAGFAVYDSSVSNHIQRGDEIVVLGKVSPYNELFELTDAYLIDKTGEGIKFDTTVVSIDQVNDQNQSGEEPYECRLVRINNISSVQTTTGSSAAIWTVTGSGTNYNLISEGKTIQVRISPQINLANLAVPSGKFDIIGVLGQYKNTYQLMPRSLDDIIIEGSGPRIISGVPFESEITPASITFSFETDSPGTTIASFGKTSAYGSTVADTAMVTSHKITIGSLEPSTVYHVRLSTSLNGDTTSTGDYIAQTSSLNSSGEMHVFFNYASDNSVSTGENVKAEDISQELLRRIGFAQYSVDIALYSLSSSVGANIASALIAAKSRGVRVRVIGEKDNSGSAPWTTLKNAGVPLIFDDYDAVNAGAGLMHNKFAVFDNLDPADTDDWVWAGSWNATDPGNNNDAQNVILIQDKSLANAYTMEFEEMWGSSSDTPDAAKSRFGARKTDNTPHRFNIGGTMTELYFDPSDNTTLHIGNALNASVSSVNIAMLTFTRSDLAQILVNKKNAGQKVRVLLDNNTDTGNQFSYMQNNGVDIHLKGSAVRGYLHHKYAVIDADMWSADQTVVTGSHNWSSAAENSNNENTLIIHSHRIANLYLQEFKARYTEAGGTDIITEVKEENNEIPSEFSLSQNYPNPFNPETTIKFSIPDVSLSHDVRTPPPAGRAGYMASLRIYDILGREIKTLVNEMKSPGNYEVRFNAAGLPSGIYFYALKSGSFYKVNKMILLK